MQSGTVNGSGAIVDYPEEGQCEPRMSEKKAAKADNRHLVEKTANKARVASILIQLIEEVEYI